MTSLDTIQTLITLYRRADKATQRIVFPVGISLTGWTVELRLRVRYAATDAVLTTESADLVIESDRVLRWTVRRAIVDPLPLGLLSDFEVQRVSGDVRETIGGGQIEVLDIGQFREAAEVRIQTPGRDGWSPLLAAETLEDGVVLRVADWTGGGGPKPGIGAYLGAAGWVSAAADATRFATVDAAQAALAAAAEALSAVQNAVQTTTQAAAQATSEANASLASAQIANGAASASITAAESATGAAATVATQAAQVAGDAQAVETARQAVAADRTAVQGLRDEVVPAAAAAATSEENAATAAAAALAVAQDTQPLSAASWAQLATLVPAYIGQQARVSATDTGSHTGRTAASPETDVTVPLNAGVYGAYALTAGAWRRDGDINVTGTASSAEGVAGTDTGKAMTPAADKAALTSLNLAAASAASSSYFTPNGIGDLSFSNGSGGAQSVIQNFTKDCAVGSKVTIIYRVDDAVINGGGYFRCYLYRNAAGSASSNLVFNTDGMPRIAEITVTTRAANQIGFTSAYSTGRLRYVLFPGSIADLTASGTITPTLLGLWEILSHETDKIGTLSNQSLSTNLMTTGGGWTVAAATLSAFTATLTSASDKLLTIRSIPAGSTATFLYRIRRSSLASIAVQLDSSISGSGNKVTLQPDGKWHAFTLTCGANGANRMVWDTSSVGDLDIEYELILGSWDDAAPSSPLARMLDFIARVTGEQPEYWSVDDRLILYPSTAYMVQGRDVSFYLPNMLVQRRYPSDRFVHLLTSAGASDTAKPPYSQQIRNGLVVNEADLPGSTFEIVQVDPDAPNTVRARTVNKVVVPAPSSGTIKWTHLGDSLGRYIAQALYWRLAGFGLTVQTYGTVSNDFDDGAGTVTGKHEGRAGWSTSDYIGRTRPGTNPFLRTLTVANPTDLAILEANPNVCFANDDAALSYAPGTGARTSYAADVAASAVKATYSIFSWSTWAANGSVSIPTTDKLIVTFGLGRNDGGATSGTAAMDTTIMALGQAFIVNDFRATFTNGRIVVACETNGWRQDGFWKWINQTAILIRKKLELFDNRTGEGVYLAPAWAHMAGMVFYPFTAGSTDTITGVQTRALSDEVHPVSGGGGYHQYAEALLGPVLHALAN
ncbi:hypothetical protein AncyloWKF20_05050 [Ancylobacter sp. WKF20]|uniref:hypothetical protein n=1 Tax=Ancylobacter sp. WKF20 TaxID=3039801 RepID=UPI00243412DC|nr:hypothetical protein [Ancylobacter sp. WKF20]WGD31191.1 hypothetical protein AncyloWKF20_05050 [Ancylobacter sp. WKF20]